jgi:peptidoglycan/LPS O-acetylase OafA/YrhL
MLFSSATAVMILYAHDKQFAFGPFAKGFVLLGTVSYSFYLIHQPVVQLVPRVLSGLGVDSHPTAVLTLCVALVLPLFFMSALMRKYVEIPSISAGYWFLYWWERKILRWLPRKDNSPIDRAPESPTV